MLHVAVRDLDWSGFDDRTARIVTDALAVELRKLRGVNVIAMDDLRALLEAEADRQLLGCEESSCLGEIADALGVDSLVVGSVNSLPGETVFALRRLDQATAAATGRVQMRLAPDEGRELLAAIGPLVEQLFPDVELRTGQTRGVSARVVDHLRPPPLSPWPFWSTAGLSGALFVGAAVAGGVSGALYAQLERQVEESASVPASGRAWKDIHSASTTAAWMGAGLALGGVVSATAAGVLALFTDFEGLSDAH